MADEKIQIKINESGNKREVRHGNAFRKETQKSNGDIHVITGNREKGKDTHRHSVYDKDGRKYTGVHKKK